MRHVFAFLLAGLFGLTSVESPAETLTGKEIVKKGGSQGATACIACHGLEGTGRAAAGFPRLAGLSASYQVRQLRAFRKGTRTSPVMAPIAKALTEREMKAVSRYYAKQHPPGAETDAPAALLAVGRYLATKGDWASGIPACVACHGPGGQGVGGPYFPALAAQHASYIVKQIKAFKTGKRTNDPIGLMRDVANALTEAQTRAVAAYFASLPALAQAGAGHGPKDLADLPPAQAGWIPESPGDVDSFAPPRETEIPDSPFGDMVRLGKRAFVHTQQVAPQYVGNGLNCVNCHLSGGRLRNAAPLWAAWPMYPAYRGKNDKVNTMIDRIQGCFMFSMNGTAPPADSKVMTALMAYTYWLAQGTRTGHSLPGRGYPDVPKPERTPSPERGAAVYAANCAMCHGENGQGKKVNGEYWFPPLWGPDSYNWGAGMHRVGTAVSFIKYNMPFGLPSDTLSVQEAWDVAAFIDHHPRPQDPRYKGSVEKTDARHHDHYCFYGEVPATD